MSQPFAMVFPGQGSQSLKMLSQLSEVFPLIKKTYQEASDVLGYDLWQLTQEGPEEKLNQTEFTQPALLTASVAIWRLWRQHSKEDPHLIAGHSLGEYSALVCAEVLNFADGVSLVAARGRYMQEAVPPGVGAMAAIIGLGPDKIKQICDEAAHNEIVAPANYNSTEQTVIAGHSAAVKRAVELAQKNGAKLAKLIPVSVPSHSLLMQPAAKRLAEKLTTITLSAPKISVIQNYDVQIHKDPEKIRSSLIQQLVDPVRWVETILLMSAQGIKMILECGPGKVLTGLNRRISPDLTHLIINEPSAFNEALNKVGATQVCL